MRQMILTAKGLRPCTKQLHCPWILHFSAPSLCEFMQQDPMLLSAAAAECQCVHAAAASERAAAGGGAASCLLPPLCIHFSFVFPLWGTAGLEPLPLAPQSVRPYAVKRTVKTKRKGIAPFSPYALAFAHPEPPSEVWMSMLTLANAAATVCMNWRAGTMHRCHSTVYLQLGAGYMPKQGPEHGDTPVCVMRSCAVKRTVKTKRQRQKVSRSQEPWGLAPEALPLSQSQLQLSGAAQRCTNP